MPLLQLIFFSQGNPLHSEPLILFTCQPIVVRLFDLSFFRCIKHDHLKTMFHANVPISFLFWIPPSNGQSFQSFYHTCLNTQDHFWEWEWIMHKVSLKTNILVSVSNIQMVNLFCRQSKEHLLQLQNITYTFTKGLIGYTSIHLDPHVLRWILVTK